MVHIERKTESRMRECPPKPKTVAKITGRWTLAMTSGLSVVPRRRPAVFGPLRGSDPERGGSAGCLLNKGGQPPTAVPRSIPPWPWQTDRRDRARSRGSCRRRGFWWKPRRAARSYGYNSVFTCEKRLHPMPQKRPSIEQAGSRRPGGQNGCSAPALGSCLGIKRLSSG